MEMAINWGVYNDDNVVEFKPVKLRADGQPKQTRNNKKAGVKAEVRYLEIEDAKLMLDYFVDREEWLYAFLFMISSNLARRNSDIRALTWKHFFNPETGKLRDKVLSFREKKTSKYSEPDINEMVKFAIDFYVEKSGCNPAANNYENPICLQLSGNYAGRVLSYAAFDNAIKRAGKDLGIPYNVGTHSLRKTFGAWLMKNNPKDPRMLETLSVVYNHSNTRVTENYTDLTHEKVRGCYDEFGSMMAKYVVGSETPEFDSKTPTISIDSKRLDEILRMAYKMGMENAAITDVNEHLAAYDAIRQAVSDAIKE